MTTLTGKIEPAVALFVERHPFPNVVRQHTQIREDELTVCVLTGATVHILNTDDMKARVVVEHAKTQQSGGTSTPPTTEPALGNAVQPVRTESLRAFFPVKFIEGTRKSPARLTFTLNLSVSQCGSPSPLKVSLSSEPTPPFLIMTNQRQYEFCERELLIRHAFSNNAKSARWECFVNALQAQFIRSTRQEPCNPVRPLSSHALAYFKEQFFHSDASSTKTMVTRKEVRQFWSWYAYTLQVLRYQRHMAQLWERGLFYGFMSKEDSVALLQHGMPSGGSCPPGTFVIRFSQSHAGQFAVAYSSGAGRVHHYLVKEHETAGAKITLPDFLHSVHSWRHLMQVCSGGGAHSSSRPEFKCLDKDVSLKEFYHSKYSKEEDAHSGYQEIQPICSE